jgi:hypothetical protein
MKQIHISNLNDIKSVFNSPSDNEQYYRILKNSNSHIINNVELAQPSIRQNNATIIWKTQSDASFKPLSELSESIRLEIGANLESFFEDFKKRANKFQNVSPDFVDKVIQIPDLSSIYVDVNENYIVIVNWAFLEDKFNPNEGVISKLFPVPNQSVLIKLINEKENPIRNNELELITTNSNVPSRTDENGFARFGTLTRGRLFTIYDKSGVENRRLAEFICDGRSEYVIKKNENVNIKLIFKDHNKQFIKRGEFHIASNYLSENKLITNDLGAYSFSIPCVDDSFVVYDENQNEIFKQEIPDIDTTYEVILDQPIDYETNEEPIFEDEIIEEDDKNITFKFVNAFDKLITGKKVSFTDSGNTTFNRTTDNNGEVHFTTLNGPNVTFGMNRYNKLWNAELSIEKSNYHIIKTKPIFPWLWWLAILVLFVLLICCLFFNCFCKDNYKHSNQTTTDVYYEPIQDIDKNTNIVDCNTQSKSGGAGVTEIVHELGNKEGTVVILYNMEYLPDKLEVFHNNKRVASTFEIDGNQDGYVGEDNAAGCCGVLTFYYTPDKDTKSIIRVTGTGNTVWEYLIHCPK